MTNLTPALPRALEIIANLRSALCGFLDDHTPLTAAFDNAELSNIEAQTFTDSVGAIPDGEPLPLALAMLDAIIDEGGRGADLARYAKRALGDVVSASLDLHAALGEAMETHIYDFDNGDVIPDDCQFQAALDGMTRAMAGLPENYMAPASPLPFRVDLSENTRGVQSVVIRDANSGAIGMAVPYPTTEDVADFMALVAAVNAQPLRASPVRIAIKVSGGLVTGVSSDSVQPVQVYTIDYDNDDPAHDSAVTITVDGGATICSLAVEQPAHTTPEFFAMLDVARAT